MLDGQRTDANEVGKIVQGPQSRIRLAEQDGQLVACIRVEQDDAHGSGYVGMFAVKPTLQGKGVGKLLLADAERVLKEELKLSKARMTVITLRDELLQFYYRRGYVATGEKEPFPYGQPEFGLPKREDLEFMVLEKVL